MFLHFKMLPWQVFISFIFMFISYVFSYGDAASLVSHLVHISLLGRIKTSSRDMQHMQKTLTHQNHIHSYNVLHTVCLLQASGICAEDKSVFPAITLSSSKARVIRTFLFLRHSKWSTSTKRDWTLNSVTVLHTKESH